MNNIWTSTLSAKRCWSVHKHVHIVCFFMDKVPFQWAVIIVGECHHYQTLDQPLVMIEIKMILWPGVSLFLYSWDVEIYHRVATQNRSIWELQNLRITEFENRRISFEILILTFHLSYSYMYFKSTNQILSLNNFCGMINHFWKTAKNMTYVKCGSH